MKLSILMPVRNGEKWIMDALSSIPEREDIELIVIDDMSEDRTYDVVELFKQHSAIDIVLIQNKERKYPGGSLNAGLDIAKGEYVVQLDCDDYFYTGNFTRLLDEKHTEDLIFFINRINNGELFDPEPCKGYCDHVCLYKRSLIGDTRHVNEKWRTGWKFHNDILAKPHTEYYSKLVCYHYNFPREGSNYDLGMKGMLND